MNHFVPAQLAPRLVRGSMLLMALAAGWIVPSGVRGQAETRADSAMPEFKLQVAPKLDARLAVGLKLDQSVYNMGEPIFATVHIINHSTRTLSVETKGEGRSGRSEQFKIQVTNANGNSVPDPLRIWLNPFSGGGIYGHRLLEPGARHQDTTLLNLHAALREPGLYTVKGSFIMEDDTEVEWPPVSFSVRAAQSSLSSEEIWQRFQHWGINRHPALVHGLQNETGRIPELLELAMMQRENRDRRIPGVNPHSDAQMGLVLLPDKPQLYAALHREILKVELELEADEPTSTSRHRLSILDYLYWKAAAPEVGEIIKADLHHPSPSIRRFAYHTSVYIGVPRGSAQSPF